MHTYESYNLSKRNRQIVRSMFTNDHMNEDFKDVLLYPLRLIIIIISLFTLVPSLIVYILYKKYVKGDWRMFIRSYQDSIDYTYTILKYLNDIDTKDIINPKDRKRVEKLIKRINKKFPNGITPESMRIGVSKMVLNSKLYDDPLIKKILDYEPNEIDLNDEKKIKRIHNIIEDLPKRLHDLPELKEFEPEEEWEEMDDDNDEEYIGDFILIDVSLGFNMNISKVILDKRRNKYTFNHSDILFLSEDGFKKNLNKYLDISLSTITSSKPKMSIIPLEKKEIVLDILKHNWKLISKELKGAELGRDIKREFDIIIRKGPEYLMDVMMKYFELHGGSNITTRSGIRNKFYGFENFRNMR